MPSSSWSASRSRRSRARWTALRCRSSRTAISDSDASGVSRRASATEPHRRTAARRGGRRRRARSIAASCRPAASTERWRFADSGVDDPVQLAAQRPGEPPRLELEQRGAAADPAEEQADRLGALPGDDSPAAPDPPRRGQPYLAESLGEERRLSAGTTNSRWVLPRARLSEPRARNRPRSQASRQCSEATASRTETGSSGQSPLTGGRPYATRGRLRRCRGPAGSRVARRGPSRLGADVAEARGLCASVTWPRRVHRRELGAQGGDEVAV